MSNIAKLYIKWLVRIFSLLGFILGVFLIIGGIEGSLGLVGFVPVRDPLFLYITATLLVAAGVCISSLSIYGLTKKKLYLLSSAVSGLVSLVTAIVMGVLRTL